MPTLPDDENGQVLRRMRAAGDDLSVARDIEFFHVLPDEGAARRFAKEAESRGYDVEVFPYEGESDVEGRWEAMGVRHMVPTHAAITAVERELAELARAHGGAADGWGCLGG